MWIPHARGIWLTHIKPLAYAPMPAGDYIEGLALFVAMLGGVLAGARLLVGRRLGIIEAGYTGATLC